jgi:hypothetical protein
MGDNFIDYDRLRAFDAKAFEATTPFPWHNMLGFLTPRAFQELFAAFPTLELFERHDNLARKHGQRPHNRYYLAYESSIYHRKDATGVVRQAQLPAAWQRFMDELRSSREYHDFIRRAIGIPSFTLRCAWHVGSRGSEVSPHLDATKKLGTHILYFNTSAEWNPDWGGETLVLGGRRTQAMNPDFGDFETCEAARIVDNRSFLFKNTPQAWHGVSALTCPAGSYRRLFNIIFEVPANRGFIDRVRELLNAGRARGSEARGGA